MRTLALPLWFDSAWNGLARQLLDWSSLRDHLSAESMPCLCPQKHVIERSLFGSVLRGDFRPDSTDQALDQKGKGW
jgi:hypothetical protein